jgi:HK97 gp10 family phage protein
MTSGINGIPELIAKLQKYGEDTELMAKQEVQTAGLEVVAAMVNDAPVDTGNLRQLIMSEPANNDLTAIIESRADYSDYMEYGTAAHVIEVKTASVLSNGKTFFGKRVNHPGTQARPFFFHNMDAGLASLKAKLQEILKNIK